MCGIYGYIGKNSAQEVLKGIKRLEYRGYDSAGIAFMDGKFNCEKEDSKNENYLINLKQNEKINFIKSKGQISELEKLCEFFKPEAELAIGHTRWATHGKPSAENSHPHLSNDGMWAIVHNGIIENYKQLKGFIKEKTFESETDTEVVVKLLEQYYNGNVLETIRTVCNMLKGSYAFGIITAYEKDKIFVAKNGSPVVACYGDDFGLVCSDLNSITSVKGAYLLENNQFAVVEKGSVKIYDDKLKEIKLKNLANVSREDRGTLGRYKHYMIKEIDEIPDAIERTVQKYQSLESIRKVLPFGLLKKIKRILIIGCGTAYHAGLIGKHLFEEVGLKTEVEIASEFRYSDYVPESGTLAIFVSQSGETADTIQALNKCKEFGFTTLAMTNVKNSSICFAADRIIYTSAGAEIGVASTKAYNCQVALFYLLAAFIKEVKTNKSGLLREEVLKLTEIAEKIRDNNIKPLCRRLAKLISPSQSIYMIGRGLDYEIAREASLKLKEISYIHCEAYPAGELKHGTISLIDDEKFVFAFATQGSLKEKMLSNVSEVASRRGKVILLSQFDENISGLYRQIKLPQTEERYMPLFVINYMQLISYFTALALGNNPDKPRALAKSVTVE